ncbi:MAG: dimethylarginine dimethylaminohydrolase family protein [Candidatus Thorarchaeota archaeon]
MMKHAIVRPPSKSYRKCISSHPLHHKLDFNLALEQHEKYCTTLSELGLDLIRLPPEDDYPDSCFVEDTAIVHGNKVAIARPAKASRQGEETSIEDALKDYKQTRRIEAPGTIEGGDVIHLEDSLISGLTQRTNIDGINQTSSWLGVQIDVIEDFRIIHLKSYVTFVGADTFVTTKHFAEHPLFSDYSKIIIPEHEDYAANTLTCNGSVLVPAKHFDSIQLLKDAGFDVISLDVSEFEKCEGALTCLSILF